MRFGGRPIMSETVQVGLSLEKFRQMCEYFRYQDRIGWNRTQTIMAIEVAVLGGAFAARGPLSLALLVGGTAIMIGVFLLIWRDWQVRDHVRAQLAREFNRDPFPDPKATPTR